MSTEASQIFKPVIPSKIAASIENLRNEGWTEDDFFNFPRYDEECPEERMLFHYFRHNRVAFAAAIINSYSVQEMQQ
ncbi:hypothetical protein A8709_21900 [Paenibacillus pectinilyticus]|uniref:Uncharacterized protein n=1 Tax=Paenibacillus pectinilyticus TaxID=512399 RepID=A0A1C0ZY24_9BACL|nr:hypothetical protein [Paenibacillus pectinilyticus]OCT12979.1 hypothetical protein A8709_21900 [Paenibacillus pectinilyticus]